MWTNRPHITLSERSCHKRSHVVKCNFCETFRTGDPDGERTGGSQAWRGRGLLLGRRKAFGSRQRWMSHDTVKVLSATQLLKRLLLRSVNFASIRKAVWVCAHRSQPLAALHLNSPVPTPSPCLSVKWGEAQYAPVPSREAQQENTVGAEEILCQCQEVSA